MGKINSYPVNAQPKLSDRLIGTSVGGTPKNETYNFTLQELKDLFGAAAGIQLTTTGSSGASTLTGDVLNIPNYTLSGLGGVPTSRTLTINGTLYDLSENRSWDVGSVTLVAAISLGTSGTDLSSSVATATTTPIITLNVPTASATNRGALSSADWITFNSKGSGTVTSVSALNIGSIGTNITSTVVSSTTSPIITLNIPTANSTNRGALSAIDWINFDGKQSAGNYITSLTGEATASGPGASTITLGTSAVTGKVLTGLNVTGGSVSASDSILTGFGKLQNQINGLIGGSVYQGTWNAFTNTPTLTSGVGTSGYYYIVNTAGSTNLDGITDWNIGDWAIFDGTAWQQVDNTDSVVSVNGFTGAVSLTTANIPEVTNLYYLDSRARAALSFTAGSGAYNTTTGVITIPTNTNQLTNGSAYITLSSLSASSPLSYNNTTGAFSIQQSTSLQDGYLSATDWNTFNDKQNYLGGTGLVKSSAGTISYITDNSTNWNTAYDNSIISAAVTGIGTKTLTLTQQDAGTITASWTDLGLTSVGVSMPSAFNVANSPLTSNGTIAITGAGTASQYVRGDGTLAVLPTGGGGGGASVSYYLNGSINQGTIGGNTYYEMGKVPIIGTGTDFSINANGYISQFITDVGDPALLNIPAGNWNLEMFFSASSSGGTPSFYVELYKYDGVVLTLISSSSATPEVITGGTSIDLYNTALAVPATSLTLTDRLAIRVYVTHSGRTITLHTENSHLCQVITTFSTGITALNGLTAQVQNLTTGTSGTDFNINSLVDTHTFNLPVASATNTGKLSSTDWNTFNNKQAAGNYITSLTGEATATGPGAAAVTLNNASVTGKVLTGVNITGGTVQATDTMLTAFGKLQNQINGLIGSTIYQGTWNASTNTPALASGVGVRGYYYIVSVAGTTNLNGISDWFVGDWAIFDGTAWQQVDNTDAVVSVNGQTGAVSLTTDNIAEGTTNLYYTEARVNANTNVAANTAARHNAVTIGTANGLSLSTQALSLALASTSATGALSSTDWNTFNDKQPAGNYVPYTGATTNVELGNNRLIAGSLTANPSSGEAQVNIKQTLTGNTIYDGFASMWSTGNNFYIGTSSGGADSKSFYFDLSSLTNITTRVYTLPNANGTLALTSDLSGYVTIGTAQNISGLKTFTALATNNEAVGIKFTAGVVSTEGYLTLNSKVVGTTNSLILAPNSTTNRAEFSFDNSALRTYTLPNTSGTLALTSDLSGYVTIGTTQVITGTKFFNEATRQDSGLLLKNGVISGSSGYTSIGGATNGLYFQLSGSANLQTLIFQSAAAYSYTLPAASGTVALTSDIPSVAGVYLPLAGGTLTGFLQSTNNINVSSGQYIGVGFGGPTGFAIANLGLEYSNCTFSLNVIASNLTANRTIVFPNCGGTVALTSDIPAPSSSIMIQGGGSFSTIRCGVSNTASGGHSFSGGGQCNTSASCQSFVGGGFTNYVNDINSSIVGGSTNSICNSIGIVQVDGTWSAYYGGLISSAGSGDFTSCFTCGVTSVCFCACVGTSCTFTSGYDSFNVESNNTYVGVFGEGATFPSGWCGMVFLSSGNTACNSFIGGGVSNCINAPFSAIGTGNLNNIIASDCSFIGAGCANNICSSVGSFIGTGNANLISGSKNSFINGQSNNIVKSCCSIILGNSNNICSVLTGSGNYDPRSKSNVISGGLSNSISNTYSGYKNWNEGNGIAGGVCNIIQNTYLQYNTISGGFCNSLGTCSTTYSTTFCGNFIGGGECNYVGTNVQGLGGGNANFCFSAIVGGCFNRVGGNSSKVFIGGGSGNNTFSAGGAAIGGGINNSVQYAGTGTISGGYGNTVCANRGTIGGGSSNTVSGSYSNIGGGSGNSMIGSGSVIAGGQSNTVCSINSGVLGGRQNVIGSSFLRSFIVGACLTAAASCTSYHNAISKTSGTFRINHPDPAKTDTKYLQHSFVESPTRGDNIYRYKIATCNCQAILSLPDYYKFLNENDQVWVSPVSHFGIAYGTVDTCQNCVEFTSNCDGEYNVLIIGTRKDKDAKDGFLGVEVWK